jgi:hypothetical protein
VLTAFIGPLVLPLALAAGILLQHSFPGDFGPGLRHGGPAVVTWIAAVGAVAAVLVGLLLGRRIEARSWIVSVAVVLFCVPIAVHGFRRWSPAAGEDAYALTPGLLRALDGDVPKRAVVFSDLETSYRIAAYAPVYVAAAPPAHVADTAANQPYGRRLAVIRYFATGDLAIVSRFHADWLVVDTKRFHVRPPGWDLTYRDARYALYHRPV